jgi:hypothetical protein
MALDDTSLINEVNTILNNGPQPVHYVWTAQITTPNGTLSPFKVLSIDLVRDYAGNISDQLTVQIAMGYGTYHQQVVPYANALSCVLTRTPVQEGTTTQDLSSDIEAQSLICTPVEISSAAVEGNNLYDQSQTGGDMVSIQTYTFQLQDQALKQTRLQSTGTTLQNMTSDKAIMYMVTKIAQNLTGLDVYHKIKGVDMVPADNTQVYANIVIPHGTSCADVPFYIAHHYGMPYSTGFGAFLQKSVWYLYPLYDLTLYDNSARSLTVINVPKNRFPTLDRTFRRTYNQLIILATGDTDHKDPSDHRQQNGGNGTRFVSADKVLNSFVSIKDNKATALRVQNATEILGQGRPDGLNNIVTGSAGKTVTSNPFKELSAVSSRMGSLITVTWENSDPGAIFPGMPCRYLYEVSGSVFEIKGQVMRTQTQISALQPGLFPSAHRNTTAITMFVEHILDWSSASTVTGS